MGISAAAAQQLLMPASVTFPASKPFNADAVDLRATLTRPQGEGPFPAVVLMHGCGGWQPAVRFSLQKHAELLAKNGFLVLSVDSFGPRHNAGGQVCSSIRKLRQARRYRSFDAFDAMHYLRSRHDVDPDNIFLMGQSNGGSVAIKAAQKGAVRKYSHSESGFRAVVAYYPWCGAFDGSRVDLDAPLLVFGGGQDDWVPPKGCRGVRAKGAPLRVEIYPDAVHSFDLNIPRHTYNNNQIGYDAFAAEDSRMKMLAFFKANLKPASTTRHLVEAD